MVNNKNSKKNNMENELNQKLKSWNDFGKKNENQNEKEQPQKKRRK